MLNIPEPTRVENNIKYFDPPVLIDEFQGNYYDSTIWHVHDHSSFWKVYAIGPRDLDVNTINKITEQLGLKGENVLISLSSMEGVPTIYI